MLDKTEEDVNLTNINVDSITERGSSKGISGKPSSKSDSVEHVNSIDQGDSEHRDSVHAYTDASEHSRRCRSMWIVYYIC